MHSRPTGTVTFLFTDIEGSTQHWEQHPDWMQPAFARQEAIIRRTVPAHGGYAYKMIGDAFQVAFATAPPALAAAIEAQAALHAEDWGTHGPLRVRMALHTGVTEERGDDYVGPALNRAARLLGLSHGSQIVLTRATHDLLRDPSSMPSSGVRLIDLGEHRLKDLIHPEQIYQVSAPGLPANFPALKSGGAIPSNLPAPAKSFIGREREIGHLRQLLMSPSGSTPADLPARLVTLTGAGGSGKTELALRVAAAARPAFADGVWLVELAPLTDAGLVPQAILTLLGLQDDPNQPALDILAGFLKHRHMLLVLDNCEHLVEICAQTADALLSACSSLRLLATTREALDVAGEVVFNVPPLATPESGQVLALEELSRFDAVRLFVERAQTAFSGIGLTPKNAPAVVRICQRLDGLPLAIELAAARVKLLSIEQIASRLEDRFSLLTAGSRTALPRHQTLRATVEWSYALLSEPEQVLFRRLAVFAGGWTLEAAEAVCAGAREAEGALAARDESEPPSQPSVVLLSPDVLDTLAQLVSKSLVLVDRRQGPENRYQMLETIREYARERLWAARDGETLAARHLAYFAGLGHLAAPNLRARDQVAWLDRLEKEHDNLRAGLAWSLEARPILGLRLATDLWWFWHIRGHGAEGCEWLERLMAVEAPAGANPPLSSDRLLVRAQALVVAGFLYGMRRNLARGTEMSEAALPMFRELGAPGRHGVATALVNLAAFEFDKDNWKRASELGQESLALYRRIDDQFGMAQALDALQAVAKVRGEHTQAITLGEEALALRRAIGDLDGIATELFSLGDLAMRQGEMERAASYLNESLMLYQTVGNRTFVGRSRFLLGLVAWWSGEPELAASQFEAALEISRTAQAHTEAAYGLLRLGDLAASQGDYGRAASRVEAFVAQARDLDDQLALGWGLERLGAVARMKEDYDLASRRLEEALAFAQATPQALALRLGVLYHLAKLALAQGDYALARSRLAESLALHRDIDDPVGLAHSLLAAAVLAASEHQLEKAARLFGATQNLSQYLTHTLPPVDRVERDQALAAVRVHLSETAFDTLLAAGRALTLGQAIDLALAP